MVQLSHCLWHTVYLSFTVYIDIHTTLSTLYMQHLACVVAPVILHITQNWMILELFFVSTISIKLTNV